MKQEATLIRARLEDAARRPPYGDGGRAGRQENRKAMKPMKHIFTGFNLVGALALLALAVGCASYQVRTTESLLSEAGFQTRTPSTPAQLAMYNQMTPYKLESNTFKGKALYSYADKQKGVAYIGGDKAYQRYKQLAAQQYQMEAAYSKMLAHEDQVWSVNYE